MASFQVVLLEGAGGSHRYKTATYTLTPVVAGANFTASEFRSSKMLYVGNSTVQKGVLSRENGPDLPAVCKVIRGDVSRLKYEAKLYVDPDHLEPIQGYYVPTFFGYYECLTVYGGCEVTLGCMILEDCGRSVLLEERLEDEIRVKIVNALLHVHHIGHLRHSDIDIDFRHVLFREGDRSIRIVDFDHAGLHNCEHTMYIDMYSYQPSQGDFKCRELYEAFIRLSVWTPTTIRFVGRPLSIFRVPTFKRLMKLVNHLYPGKDNSWMEPKARQVLRDYYTAYRNRFSTIGHPLQHKLPLGIPGVADSDDEDTEVPASQMAPSTEPQWEFINVDVSKALVV